MLEGKTVSISLWDDRLFPLIRCRMESRAPQIGTFQAAAVKKIFTNERLQQVRDCDPTSYRIWAEKVCEQRGWQLTL